MKNKYLKLIFSLTIPFVAGIIGSYFTTPAISTWYASLIKPDLNPPNWVFGPAWTTLYILMGIALFLVWQKEGKEKHLAIIFFAIQLFLNTTWSIIFFAMQNPLMAFINIVLLWLTIIITIVLFYRISKKTAYLLFPYILWVSFAAYLNYSIWILN